METSLAIAHEIVEQTYPLSKEGLQAFASILIRTEVRKGQNFLNEGEVCTQMGYIYKGMVRQYYYKNGKEMTEHISNEGNVFICIESFLQQKPTRLIVEALENTVIYGIPYKPLLQLAAESMEIERVYRGMLQNSLIMSQTKMDMFRFESAKDRYLRLMREQPEVIKRAPLSYIASYLLMTPETLSRVRASII